MQRINVKGELVSFRNEENYLLDGILYHADNSSTTIVHIHGSYGNFYQNHFLRFLAKKYMDVGYSFLSFNLRAHDGFAEGYRNIEDFEYVGGAITEYSTYISDVNGALSFIQPFTNKVILQGHSMGCDKVIGYMLHQKKEYDCILLSPSDSYTLQGNWLKKHFDISVEQQIESLRKIITSTRNKNDIHWLPYDHYGVYYTNDEHFLPVSADALLSILTSESFWAFNMIHPKNYYINSNCFVYLGGMDELQTSNHKVMLGHIKDRFKSMSSFYLSNTEHMMDNIGPQISEEVVKWLQAL